MKILMINTTFSQGGAAKVVQYLHSALNKVPKFSSYFAYGRGRKIVDKKVFRFAFLPEVYFHAFLTRLTGLQGYGTYFSTKRLEKFILKEKFDLIHIHNIHGYYLNLNFIEWFKKTKIPIVWTLHDEWPITGRCAYCFECDRWKTGCGNCPNLSWYPKTYFNSSAFMWQKKKEIFTSKWNPIIVCPSQWLADKVKESYLRNFRIEIIPNGIDTEVFKPKNKTESRKNLNLPLGKKIILFIATKLEDERKGKMYFFEALKHIKAKDWMVLMVGKKISLNKKISRVDNIKQIGYVADRKLISEIYNTADLFCITSLDDNFPTTVLESMACGTPVAGFKVGGISEQVSDGCGILVKPRDSRFLAEAIDDLLNDDKKRKILGENCRRRILENYSIDKFKERYINLYKSLLN